MTFAEWRARYRTLSDADHRAAAAAWYAEHPTQQHWSLADARAFFAALPDRCIDVLEMGGYRGELAAELLPANPRVARWTNVDLCAEAVRDTVCLSPRYEARVAATFRWWRDRADWPDVFVATHALEHLDAEDARELLAAIDARWLYLEVPLPEDARPDWAELDYEGSHALELSWREVAAMLGALGWAPLVGAGTCRGFARVRGSVRA